MYQIPELLKYPKLFHAFSEKADGNMASVILGQDLHAYQIINNREKFFLTSGVDMTKSACMWVEHGDNIVVPQPESYGVSMVNRNKAIKTDGLITNQKEKYLFLLIADCLPILLYDFKKSVVCLLHAGWKGVDLEIANKAVDKMRERFGSDPLNIVVGIGPCAYKDSFIKKNPNQEKDPRWRSFLETAGANIYKVDLVGFTKKQLVDAGVRKENIFESGIDTVKDKRFFSHVRENSLPLEKQGRFACIVGIKS